MKSSPSRRSKFTFGKLFALLFFLLVLTSRWLSPLHQLQEGIVYNLFRPFLYISNTVWNPLEKIWERYIYLVGARFENENLKKENSILQQSLLESQAQLSALDHYQKIQSFWQKSTAHLEFAEIVAYDPIDPSQGIWLNRGSENGIMAGQAVVADEGLVGIISKVFPKSAKVMPLISPNSAVDVELNGSGARGILKGKQDQLYLHRSHWVTRIEYLGNAEKVELGDLVSSSGLDKAYPRGLVIGKIQNIQKDEKGLFVSADVLPEVDFAKLREVAVIIQ